MGQITTYPHSGYVVYLGGNRLDFITHIHTLKAAGWLDVRTRAVFIEFTMQNININQYAVVTIAFEISSTGLILQKLDLLYTRIHMYTRRLDYFRLFCEVVFGLWMFYLVWSLVHRVMKHGWNLFCKFWDVHAMFVCATSAAVVALSIYRLVIFLKVRPYLKKGVPLGYDLRHEAIIDWAIQACMGFLCFLVITKVIL